VEDLDKDAEKKLENSKDNMGDDGNDKSPESNGSFISGIISNIKKFTISDDLNQEITANKKTEDKDSKNSKNSFKEFSNNINKKDETSQKNVKSEDHDFNITNILSGHDSINSLRNKKDKIIKASAILIGGFLIVYGLILISASVTKVADNVIFGEGATISSFLILLGILIIVAAFAQSILNRTFLNKIHNELEVAEGRSESEDGSKKVKDENGNKDKDNKDNIVGENKR
jgi:hypothetical protein